MFKFSLSQMSVFTGTQNTVPPDEIRKSFVPADMPLANEGKLTALIRKILG